MSKQKEQLVPITLRLTPSQVEALLQQVMDVELDWMNDPQILRVLAKRDHEVAGEIRSGEFATLEELQSKWAKRQAKAKGRSTR
jgi:hypothetical protein